MSISDQFLQTHNTNLKILGWFSVCENCVNRATFSFVFAALNICKLFSSEILVDQPLRVKFPEAQQL